MGGVAALLVAVGARLAAMSEPTPPRWPALRGLRLFLARDFGLLLAALFAPFIAMLRGLRRLGLEGTGAEPDPLDTGEGNA